MSDLMLAVNTLRERQDDYDKAERYALGETEEFFASAKLRRALQKTGTSFRINFAKTPIEAVLDRLEIAAVSTESPEHNDLLQTIMEDNDFEIESNSVHRWSLTYRECYVFVWTNEDDKVDIVYNSPKTTAVFYEDENPRKKRFGAKVWSEGEGVRVNLYYADRIEKYVSKEAKPKKLSDFARYVDDSTDENGIAPNPFGQVPIFHFRTDKHMPRPEHADAYGPQDMINKLVITQMATTDFHGFPQRYVLAGGTPSDEGDDFDEANPTDESSSLTSGPGELWWLQGEGLSVGQFDAADVNNFLEPFRQYVRSMATVTKTPLHEFDPSGDKPSGESLRTAEAPLIKKVKKRAALFGATWREVFQFALEIMNVQDRVTIQWHNPESSDSKDSWETAVIQQSAGVPKRQTMLERGYTEDQLDEWGIVDTEPAPVATVTVES